MSEGPKRLAVFGCGYVGTALVGAALARGWLVETLTRNAEKAAVLRHLGVRVVEADLAGTAWHGELTGDFDYAVCCVSASAPGDEGYRQSYCRGQLSIFEWASTRLVSRYLYTGSTGVYPQTNGELVREEDAFDQPPGRQGIIREAEKLVEQNARLFDAWYILRLGGIYGPDRHYLLDQLDRGETTFAGHGEYLVNVIHRDDIVSAILTALDADPPQPGVYNVTDGHPAKKREMVAWLAAKRGLPTPTFDPEVTPVRQRSRPGADGRVPDRQVCTDKIREKLAWSPRFPDFRAGYEAILASTEAN